MRRLIWALAIGVMALPMAAFAATADQEVAQQIADSLRSSGRLQGYSIAVKYKEGTARLEGSVRNPQQAEQAADMVNRHPSVKRVINNLSVDANPVASQPAEPRPAAPQPQPQFQPQVQPQLVEARSASTPVQAHPASVLMPRMQQQTPSQQMPSQAPQMLPAAASQAAEQPMREASLRRVLESGPPFRKVAAPMYSQPQPMPAPAPGTQPMFAQPRPMSSVLAQAPSQPMAGRMPMQAQMGQQMPYAAGRPMPGRPMPGQPMPVSYRQGEALPMPGYNGGGPSPEYMNPGMGTAPAVYDQPHMPNYSWPSYAPYPNYAALTYPKQYSPTAWPYIGPFYPYPQVPLGWRKVTLEWDDGWWFLNFADDRRHCGHY